MNILKLLGSWHLHSVVHCNVKKKREKDAANVSPFLNKGGGPFNNLHFLFLGKSM